MGVIWLCLEKVSIETLFTMQENYIFYDAKGILKQLRGATVTSMYPKYFWKKKLLIELNMPISEDFYEFKLCVKRSKFKETYIIFGVIFERILRVGFYIFNHYYPWHTHLNWGFKKLPDEIVIITPLDTSKIYLYFRDSANF